MDYRDSHLSPGKGISYDSSFQNLRYRNAVWHWEQRVLHGIVAQVRRNTMHIRYLDFACGTGRILRFIEDCAEESFGIDVSQSMLDVAARNVKKSTLLLGDLTREHILDASSVNLVTAFRFFLNAQPSLREEALHAIHRVLKDDGYLVFNIHMNKGSVLERLLRIYMSIRKLDRHNLACVSREEMKLLLGRAGFEIIDLYHYGILPIYSENTRIPLRFIEALEGTASSLPFLESYSQHIVYVCKKLA